jgi:hypothetical protein
MCCSQLDNSLIHQSPLDQAWRIQVHLKDQSLDFRQVGVDGTVLLDLKFVGPLPFARILNLLGPFHGVTATARLNKVLIVDVSFRHDGLRFKVIDFEFARDLSPGLAFQAKHASK